MVMVNGELYIDTGHESTVEARCGVMDGETEVKSQQKTINLTLVQAMDINMVHKKA